MQGVPLPRQLQLRSGALLRHGPRRAFPGIAKPGKGLPLGLSQAMADTDISPAVLPGTPATFPIAQDRLISLAQEVFKSNSGVDNPDLLSDDFRFEFPVVSLAKKVRFFPMASAFRTMPSCINVTGMARQRRCTAFVGASQDLIKAVRSFNLKKAFPNLQAHPYDWRVDKYEPNR